MISPFMTYSESRGEEGFLFYFVVVFFETVSLYNRLALNLRQSSCLGLPSTGLGAMCRHAQLCED